MSKPKRKYYFNHLSRDQLENLLIGALDTVDEALYEITTRPSDIPAAVRALEEFEEEIKQLRVI